MKKQTKANLALLFATFIWGSTFVPVQNAIGTMPPLTFNALRFLIGFLALAIIYRNHLKGIGKQTIIFGSTIGLALFLGYAFQTLGLKYTKASNSAFITSLSVVFVPIMWSIKTKKLPPLKILMSIALATIGLALVTLDSNLGINKGDMLTLLCAVCFALSIILIDSFIDKEDPTLLVIVEIGIVSILSFILSIFTGDLGSLIVQITHEVIFALFITGLFATALAILIQNKAQRLTSPTHAALIFSAEPVFAALTSFILLGERMSFKNLVGGVLILMAVIISEVDPHKLKGSIFALTGDR
ncbi:MAG: DMT family transporter [Clostridiales bacterium]|nr:DMT family transporter [Clostridiales bacterium]